MLAVISARGVLKQLVSQPANLSNDNLHSNSEFREHHWLAQWKTEHPLNRPIYNYFAQAGLTVGAAPSRPILSILEPEALPTVSESTAGFDSLEEGIAFKQSEDKPEACFVIPTFNRVDALKLCLQHLERQTVRNFEVILVDDGSTDATPQVIAEYLKVSPLRIRSFRQENSGPARARNLAIGLTQAPVCIIIGDDILCNPDFCARHLQFHHENPDLRSVGLGLTIWSESLQTVTPFMRWMDESGAQFAYHDLLRGTKPEWFHFYTSNLSVKTQLLRENPFNQRFTRSCWMMEDMELGYRLQRQDLLRMVLLRDALAEHFHPTDFRKACKRAYAAGLSARVFDELWPDRNASKHGIVHRVVRQLLCLNAWLLPPVSAVTLLLTKVWCPNPLLQPVLAWHTAVAKRRGS